MAIKLTARALKNKQHEQNIQQAALSLFAEYDFDTVTVDDICREAGVSKSTFYNLYKQKEDLLMIEVDKRRGDFITEHYAYDDSLSFKENLCRFFLVNFDFVLGEGPQKTRMVYRSYMSVGDVRSDFASSSVHPYMTALNDLVRRGTEAGAFTVFLPEDELLWLMNDALIGLFIGWASHIYPSGQTDERYRRAVAALAETFIRN